jgi:UDP-N-acetylglucosamine 1-carboxyvinyltransferase
MHIAELNRMGAHIQRQGPHAIIEGVRQLCGARVMASDLRASACLVLAGLAARGLTSVSRIYHLERGYDNLDEKLRKLGVNLWREREKK